MLKRSMHRFVVFAAAVAVACSAPEPPAERPAPAAAPAAAPVDPVRRGDYLVRILACNECHTPWSPGPNGRSMPDMSRMLSGHPSDLVMPPPPELPDGPWVWLGSGSNTAFAGPWGVSYATNLTPHEHSGMGIWTEEMFIRAMRDGRHMGSSRRILPPMPWGAYSRMSEQDLRAIFAYLRTLPPIDNLVPDPVIAEAPGP
jgi:hypothetical protein